MLELDRVDCSSASIVQGILERSPRYQLNTQNAPLEEGAGLDVFRTFPPNCGPDQKHVLLISKNKEYAGVIDVIIKYPEEQTAFLGLLLLEERFQGTGLGKESVQCLEIYLSRLPVKMKKIRLAWVKSNPVLGFWEKVGFIETGETKSYHGENLESISIIMEKELN